MLLELDLWLYWWCFVFDCSYLLIFSSIIGDSFSYLYVRSRNSTVEFFSLLQWRTEQEPIVVWWSNVRVKNGYLKLYIGIWMELYTHVYRRVCCLSCVCVHICGATCSIVHIENCYLFFLQQSSVLVFISLVGLIHYSVAECSYEELKSCLLFYFYLLLLAAWSTSEAQNKNQ